MSTMDSINTQAIIDLILQDAKTQADAVMADADRRVSELMFQSGLRLQRLEDEARSQADRDAKVQDDRIRRLHQLEYKKELVAGKRGLLEQAFTMAVEALNSTPEDQVAAIMTDLLVQYASGEETLIAGAVNDAFFTEDFVNAANESLQKAGKPGKLVMGEGRRDGVCGLVLTTTNSELQFTFLALMENRQEELEAQVAAILFPADGQKE